MNKTDSDFRFGIVERESENEPRDKVPPRAKSLACDHTQALDLLNDAMDQLAEVSSKLEIVARGLYNAWGAR